jgi:uncharacterized protein involved in tolerance to divalent cations
LEAVSMEYYQEDQIFELNSKGGENGKISINVRPELETLYFLSGAVVEEKNDHCVIKLVKCRLRTTCDVDYKAEPVEDDAGLYVLEIEKTNKDYVFDLGKELRPIEEAIEFSN